MARKHGPWTINSRTEKYKGELLKVYEDDVVKPNGETGTYSIATLKEGVNVLALDDEGFVYLSREFRYAVGRETIETVGGAMEDGEETLEAARRELREELGIEAEELIEMGQVDPITSMIDSPSHLFLARNLTFTESDQDSGETIERVKMKLEEAVQMVMQSRITHGSSCVLILKTERWLKKSNDE